MSLAARRAQIASEMPPAGFSSIAAFHDGTHFIETPNPVTVLTGFKGVGDCAAVIAASGETTLYVSPAWDADRARDEAPGVRVVATASITAALPQIFAGTEPERTGLAGLGFTGWRFSEAVRAGLNGAGRDADDFLMDFSRAKTEAELRDAEAAAALAEKLFDHMLEIARPGMREDELAARLRLYGKSLGAEDNFLLLCAGPHNRGVNPSSGRPLTRGDVILAEITPSVGGQMTQICRAISVGPPAPVLAEKYALVVEAMKAGIAAARPGALVEDICIAINRVLEAAGYGEYCYPPYIRRRGHGLGFASLLPGDIALGNKTVLEPGMMFVIHPNQYLPEAGYLLCGEPTVITAEGARTLTRTQARLAEIAA